MAGWCTALIDPQRLRAAQLEKPSDFQKVVKARKGDLRALHDCHKELKSRGYISLKHEDGTRTVWLFYRVGEDYNLSEEHVKTLQRKRVDITPHGRFWSLPDRNVFSAAKFLQHFGPLDRPMGFEVWTADEPRDKYAWQDLGDFWNKMRRFKAVTTTWITLEDVAALKKSWLELQSQLTQINQASDFPFGSSPLPGQKGAISIESELLARMEDCDQHSFQTWLEALDFRSLQKETVSLIECELQAQLQLLSTWQATPGNSRPGFRLTLTPLNLWTALWYFFAQDTTAGVGWRICPHCQKLFYPPRRDRFYCKSELQVQYSRLRWWNEHREEELEKRKAKRRQLRPAKRRRQGAQS